MKSDAIFLAALSKLLIEIFDGPPGPEAYILNPGDPGLLPRLDQLSAEEASARPMPGTTTIASHTDHVCYGFELMNRWAAGHPNPWGEADWDASWKRPQVTAREWQELRERLRGYAEAWRRYVATRTEWNEIEAAGALASLAHTTYHLGAIRQLMAALHK